MQPDEPDWDDASGAWQLSGASEGGLATKGERYEPLRTLGVGGMGEVLLERDTVLRREVAIKRPLGDPCGPQARRLIREARITAALDHPGIVAVFDAGEDEEGRPYYVMRAVRGQALSRALAGCADLAARLGLLRHLHAACEAMASAHAVGILHRDLKPDNILVGAYGETQVMDWGLARPLAEDGTWDDVLSRDLSTRAGAVLGTPAYMAPEQAAGEVLGPQADVWALGVILYELLAGERAFSAPSERELMARVLSARPQDLREVVPEAPPDLVAIAQHAMRARPADRYADAGELARDLGRYLAGVPVRAREQSRAEWMRRTLWTWRGPLIGTAVAVGVSAVVGVGAARLVAHERELARTAEQALDDLRLAADVAEAGRLRAEALHAVADGNRSLAEQRAVQSLQLQEHPGARGILARYGVQERPRLLASHAGPRDCTRPSMGWDGERVFCVDDGVVWGWGVDGEQLWEADLGATDAFQVADDTLRVELSESRVGLLLDPATGQSSPRRSPTVYNRGGRRHFTRSPMRWVESNFEADKHVVVTDLTAYRTIQSHDVCTEAGGADGSAMGPSGTIYSACDDGSVQALPPDGPARTVLPAGERRAYRLALGGERWLSACDAEGDTWLVDLERGEVVLYDDNGGGLCVSVAVREDGPLVAVRHEGVVPRVLSPDGSQPLELPSDATVLGFDGEGNLVAAGRSRLERWRLPASRARNHYVLGEGVTGLDWRAGTLAASAGNGFWRAGGAVERWQPENTAKDVALCFDGRMMGVLSGFGGLLDAATGTVLGRSYASRRVACLASGRVLSMPYGRGLYLWPADTSRPLPTLVPTLEGADLDVAGDGSRAAWLAETKVYVFDDSADTLESVVEDVQARAVAVSDDGHLAMARERLLVTAPDGAVLVDEALPGGALELAMAPDASLVAVGGFDGEVWVYSVDDGVLRGTLSGHEQRVPALAFSPDGTQLASGSWDMSVRVWDLTMLLAPVEQLQADIDAAWGTLQ